MDRLAPDWDTRLNIVGLETTTGRRVVFRRENDHGLTVGEAVRASCAIPGVFKPIESNGKSYVDGGVWSPANLDAVASRRGDNLVALLPIGGASESGNPRTQLLFETFRSIVAGEVIRLRNRGVRVATIAPDRKSAVAIGPDRMDASREALVGQAGLAQGHALAGPLADWLDRPG
jgi:NTE family protein